VGENTNQIEQEIRARREDLGRNLNELEDKARDLADWRTHYRNHSGAFLSVAFSAGVVLALAAVPRRDRSAVQGDEFIESEPRREAHRPMHAAWPGRPAGNGTAARALRQLGETWSQITDALLRTASAKAIQVVANLVPEVKNHLDARYTPTDEQVR
jgi:hypothetical protein